jgi:hypothetical protein
MIEVNHARAVFVLLQQVVEKVVARGAFRAEHAALAEAGVDQKADGHGQIVFHHEVFDVLRMVIFGENKIVLREILDDLTLSVAHCGQNADDFDDAGEVGLGWILSLQRKRGRQEGE